MRLGDTVTAVWFRLWRMGRPRLFTVLAGFWPAREAAWIVPETAWVSASGSEASDDLGFLL